jgi:hypothetical protein
MLWSCQDTRMSRSSEQVHLRMHISFGVRKGRHNPACTVCRCLFSVHICFALSSLIQHPSADSLVEILC